MDGALMWVSNLVQWFGQFIPRWVILDPTMGAVKFVGGDDVQVLGPGWHWWWPARTKLSIYPVARQANNLQAQTITTIDGKTVTIAGLIVYEVEDLAKLLAETFDPDDSIRDIALSVIHDVAVDYTWDALQAASRKTVLATALRKEAAKQLEPYGVKVLKMAITDLAPCRVLRLMGTPPTEVVHAVAG